MVKTSLIDPQTAMKNEALLNLKRAQEQIETAGKLAVVEATGKETRRTEELRGKNAVGLQDRKFGHDLVLADTNNASRERVGLGNNAATRYSADAGKDGRIAVAEAKAAGVKAADISYDSEKGFISLTPGEAAAAE